MKIGEMARRTDCTVETIRFYEREGLLPNAMRTEANYRIYGEKHIERLSFIRYCRSLDMTLDEIRVLLRFMDAPLENCSEVNRLLDEHINHVAVRIQELRTLELQLKKLRKQCHAEQDAAHCGILQELSLSAHTDAKTTKKTKPMAHVHGTHRAGRTKG